MISLSVTRRSLRLTTRRLFRHLTMKNFAQSAEQSKIADQVKVDVMSHNQRAENEAHIKHVARSFICEHSVDRNDTWQWLITM